MLVYLAAVFALTLALQLPALFLLPESTATMAMLAVAGCAPGLIALVMRRRTAVVAGHALAAALAAFAIPVAVRVLASLPGGGPVFQLPAPDATTIFLVTFVPIFEELGWRGRLQPAWEDALRRRTGRGPRWAVPRVGVVVGVIWALWHLPMFIHGDGTAAGFVVFLLALTAASVWMAALVELSGRRVWVAMIAHASMNLQLVASSGTTTGLLVGLAAHAGFAVLTVWWLGRAATSPPP